MFRVVIVCVLSLTLTVVCREETDTWKKGCIDRCKKRTQPDSDHEPDEYDPDDHDKYKPDEYDPDDHDKYGPYEYEPDEHGHGCEGKCDDCVYQCVDFQEYTGSCAKSCMYACERCGQKCQRTTGSHDRSVCRDHCRTADMMECKGDNDCVDGSLQCIKTYGEPVLETCFKCGVMCKNSCPCIRNCMQCNNEKKDDSTLLLCVVCTEGCAGDDGCRSDCFEHLGIGAGDLDDRLGLAGIGGGAPKCNDVPTDDSTRLVSPRCSYFCAGDDRCRRRCAQCMNGCDANGCDAALLCLSDIIKKDRNVYSCRGQGFFSDMAYKLFRDLLAPRRHR